MISRYVWCETFEKLVKKGFDLHLINVTPDILLSMRIQVQ